MIFFGIVTSQDNPKRKVNSVLLVPL